MTIKCKLKACDLVYGREYFSPSGRRVRLLHPKPNGISNTAYIFEYVRLPGQEVRADDGFPLSACNATAIAAMIEIATPSKEQAK